VSRGTGPFGREREFGCSRYAKEVVDAIYKIEVE
jgi:hypothetical protein